MYGLSGLSASQGQNSTIWQVDVFIMRISGEPINKQADVKIGDTSVLGNYLPIWPLPMDYGFTYDNA